jgi:hypothetical protein
MFDECIEASGNGVVLTDEVLTGGRMCRIGPILLVDLRVQARASQRYGIRSHRSVFRPRPFKLVPPSGKSVPTRAFSSTAATTPHTMSTTSQYRLPANVKPVHYGQCLLARKLRRVVSFERNGCRCQDQDRSGEAHL